jgi:hypothetical protein
MVFSFELANLEVTILHLAHHAYHYFSSACLDHINKSIRIPLENAIVSDTTCFAWQNPMYVALNNTLCRFSLKVMQKLASSVRVINPSFFYNKFIIL